MQHISLPDDNFEALFDDYAAETPDDGFSDVVMAKINEQTARQILAKRICLYAAIFIGGLIAGKQVLALLEVWQSPDIMSSLSSLPLMPILVAVTLPFLVWLFEQQEITL